MKPLSANERFLLLILGVLLFGSLNFIGYRWLSQKQAKLNLHYAELRADKADAQVDLQSLDLWTQRKQWLTEHQPSMGDEGDAKAQLLQFVLKGARDHQLEILEQSLNDVKKTSAGPCVTVSVKVKGSMEGLCRWLAEVQIPQDFYAITSFSLKADQDQKSMICSLQVTRYFKEGS